MNEWKVGAGIMLCTEAKLVAMGGGGYQGRKGVVVECGGGKLSNERKKEKLKARGFF